MVTMDTKCFFTLIREGALNVFWRFFVLLILEKGKQKRLWVTRDPSGICNTERLLFSFRMEPMDEFDADEIKAFVKKLQKGK